MENKLKYALHTHSLSVYHILTHTLKQYSKHDICTVLKLVGDEHDEYRPALAFFIPFNYINLEISAAFQLTLSCADKESRFA